MINWRAFGFGVVVAFVASVLTDAFSGDALRKGFALTFAIPVGLLAAVAIIVLSIVSK
jgi:hypothetical protein